MQMPAKQERQNGNLDNDLCVDDHEDSTDDDDEERIWLEIVKILTMTNSHALCSDSENFIRSFNYKIFNICFHISPPLHWYSLLCFNWLHLLALLSSLICWCELRVFWIESWDCWQHQQEQRFNQKHQTLQTTTYKLSWHQQHQDIMFHCTGYWRFYPALHTNKEDSRYWALKSLPDID